MLGLARRVLTLFVFLSLFGLILAGSVPVSEAAPKPTDEPLLADNPSDHRLDRLPAGTDPDCPVEEPTASNGPHIVELYPNPPIEGNEGEYVVLTVPETDVGSLSITDGHTTASVPSPLPATRVALSTAPNETATLTDDPIVELNGTVRLAASGDELTVKDENGPIETVVYDRAPDAEIWYRQADATADHPDGTHRIYRGEWWPQDATCLPTATVEPHGATAFVLPDSPEHVLETIDGADERIALAGYTFTDDAVADALTDALDRGVEVDVLVEASPVGGIERSTDDHLVELDAAGATVHATGGEAARFGFHHPKYAVVDDAILVTTENWKPAGVGGRASRGWGVTVENEDLANELAAIFEADATGHDATPWAEFRAWTSFVEDDPSTGSFPEHHPPEAVDVETVELLISPDNARHRFEELLESAEESIQIVQVQIEGPEFSLLETAIDAAREGVEVSILLDDSWYVSDENRELASRIESIAERDGLPIDVHRTDGGDRFDRVHAKGVVIDGEVTILGSHNWNDHSLDQNREVALVLHGEEAAAYYASVFDGDWNDETTWSIPVELVLVGLGGVALVVIVTHRYVEFSATPGQLPPEGDRSDELPPRPIVIEGSAGVEPASRERSSRNREPVIAAESSSHAGDRDRPPPETRVPPRSTSGGDDATDDESTRHRDRTNAR